MNCRDAEHWMALHLGNDPVDDVELNEARRHVAVCPDCQATRVRLKASLTVLEKASSPDSFSVQKSLWPELSERLEMPRRAKGFPLKSNGLRILSATVACSLLVVLGMLFPARHPPGSMPGNEIGKQHLSPFPSFSEPQSQPHLSREAREALERANRNRQLREKASQLLLEKK
ncbi:hypothetical protein [Planctomicrobium sp. SH527]|uniref:hypothetical protein n=1 Tax=Planctomicrobium sp. SH527 TaxID=3448123 RepID=UPI003F5B7510